MIVKEVEKMTAELLREMDDMLPETIENFRKDWFEKEKRKKLRSEKVDNYVNALCDRAIARAKRKMLLNTAEA